ncbi:hypothetical protein BDE02_01G070600 [Populus trichocarpa]|nr:hypothetical protein BDE02_01G070600 [Populus trichocarpa]
MIYHSFVIRKFSSSFDTTKHYKLTKTSQRFFLCSLCHYLRFKFNERRQEMDSLVNALSANGKLAYEL